MFMTLLTGPMSTYRVFSSCICGVEWALNWWEIEAGGCGWPPWHGSFLSVEVAQLQLAASGSWLHAQ
jgi:hypothetical protein